MKQFFRENYSWQSVYYHFQKWSKNGSWKRVWNSILKKHKHHLDLSSIQLDGTHTPAKRGGESVAYQGRKKSKTTNSLILIDSQGIPLTCSDPVAGNHNDSFNLVKIFGKMIQNILLAGIPVKGLFLNANSGFDTSDFRLYCYANEIFDNIDRNKRNGSLNESHTVFDNLLYKVRFETNNLHWKSLLLLAFSVILLRKLYTTSIY